jgi:transcriptional regulator with XRE-family HTH domain
MYLSSNIKYLRTKKGLTQIELAKELEKTSAAISDYEKGKSIPPMDVAFRISRFFEVSIDDLVNKNLRKEDILTQEGIMPYSEATYQAKYEQLLKQLQTKERLTELLEHRLAELEREIREQAPGLAKRLGLE